MKLKEINKFLLRFSLSVFSLGFMLVSAWFIMIVDVKLLIKLYLSVGDPSLGAIVMSLRYIIVVCFIVYVWFSDISSKSIIKIVLFALLLNYTMYAVIYYIIRDTLIINL